MNRSEMKMVARKTVANNNRKEKELINKYATHTTSIRIGGMKMREENRNQPNHRQCKSETKNRKQIVH